MATKQDIRDMLAKKAQQLDANSKAEELKASLLVMDKITRCKHGGAYKHKQVLRSSQSRNYAGAGSIPRKLKEEATLLTKLELAPLMGESLERVSNLTNGRGAVVSQRSIKRARNVQRLIHKLKAQAKDMEGLSEHHEFIEPKVSPMVLVKKTPRDKGYQGSHGISAYSREARSLSLT